MRTLALAAVLSLAAPAFAATQAEDAAKDAQDTAADRADDLEDAQHIDDGDAKNERHLRRAGRDLRKAARDTKDVVKAKLHDATE